MSSISKVKTQHTLHEMRVASGKTGSTISRVCHTTYQSLRNWETGANIPDVVTIDELLRLYGYTYEELNLTPFRKGKGVINNKRPHIETQDETKTLYEMRQLKNMTGHEVAELCGISYRSLRYWETGENIPDIISIDDLLQVYGYSFYDLDVTPFREIKARRIEKQKENEI